MAKTTKKMNLSDANQVLKTVYNETGALCTEGWVTGFVGREIRYSFGTTDVANDTQFFTYLENDVELLVLANIYSDGTRTTLLKTKRIS